MASKDKPTLLTVSDKNPHFVKPVRVMAETTISVTPGINEGRVDYNLDTKDITFLKKAQDAGATPSEMAFYIEILTDANNENIQGDEKEKLKEYIKQRVTEAIYLTDEEINVLKYYEKKGLDALDLKFPKFLFKVKRIKPFLLIVL